MLINCLIVPDIEASLRPLNHIITW